MSESRRTARVLAPCVYHPLHEHEPEDGHGPGPGEGQAKSTHSVTLRWHTDNSDEAAGRSSPRLLNRGGCEGDIYRFGADF